ncbi:MAG TPA: histidinol dehydrogenase [Phycisphaerae bacterium]|nr:histidinol dehydrogenase [Phycisphaerae bacterium]HRR85339.1 histidinol dehydrogenase [Phycisphaerae bacterium]
MPRIRVIRTTDPTAMADLATMRQSLLLDHLILDEPPQTKTVRDIIAEVRRRGDDAVSEITARVDHATVPPDQVRVPPERIARAQATTSPALRAAIQKAIEAVRQFQQSILLREPSPIQTDGLTLSLRVRPLRRVGVCVPGAAAPLLSSVIHSALPAQVAGVKEIAVVAPPRHNGDIHPTILAVCGQLGITEVYRMGGAQAIAALALGTRQVPRVDKIVGPGGMYVQLAKRYLYGLVDIDMFAATTEVLIIADRTARPAFVAADMLAQAEHNPGSAILLTDDESLLDKVLTELDRQLAALPTANAAAKCLEELGAIVIVRNMDEAAEMADQMAPEHLQIETANPRDLADRINAAGAVFLGHFSPESAGDYVAGPSHTLPTGGTARFWSGLSSLSFLRTNSMIEYTAEGIRRDAPAIDLIGRAENLEAHARSATIRAE